MKFSYEDLSDDQFERLIVLICQKLLGLAVQGFAKGPDGGRDAKFVGTAERFPSPAGPWAGTVVIQAKHTNGYNRHFGESDFFSAKAKDTVIAKELPRIIKLREAGKLDHYMLFANRRLAGGANDNIIDHIAEASGLAKASIFLCGVEQLELYLAAFPEVVGQANLDRVEAPLIVSSEELAVVVQAIAGQQAALLGAVEAAPRERTSFEKKNELNAMTAPYAKALRQKYLKDTAQIGRFLAAPENAEIRELYELTADEFNLKILSKRKNHQNFDEVMEYLLDLLFQRDPILRQNSHKKLTRAVLFYMYWNCDIGEVADAEA